MTLIERWSVYAQQLARCMVATFPDYMDLGFSEVAATFLDGKPPQVDETRPEGTWLRAELGFAYIGPPGGDHFYTKRRPDGVPDEAMQTITREPPGRLRRALDDALAEARAMGLGGAIDVRHDSGVTSVAATGDELEMVHRVGTLLEGARAASQPGYNEAVLREQMGLMLQALGSGKTPIGGIRAMGESVLALRRQFAADGWLFALAFTRTELAGRLLDTAPGAVRLVHMSYDSASSGHEPERTFASLVQDYVAAGHAGLVVAVIEQALGLAREQKTLALDAKTVTGHWDHLYQAAAVALTAWLLSDFMRRMVQPAQWPERMSGAKWQGYVAAAEETVVRASIALEVGCINAGSQAALDRFIGQVATQGAARADELIEEYLYYPRGARDVLLCKV